ncbi:6-phosphofructokinase [Bacillus xiapuensis]|uniref:6-phosphofructokinase n=1 Tax=Bacillus xiapuensis TaxID=2014075 RepID=UPI000C245D8C|nr:6-phosphofructokinase [Bacillus xiapuensis]
MKGNCMIVQSGGPTAVINNSMVGIIDAILQSPFSGKIYGAAGGIHGLLNESFIILNHLSIQDRYRLRWTPGAALGTWRHKLTAADVERIVAILRENDVRFFFYIGGNGSMNVAKAIGEYADAVGYEIAVIGVPKSIDNDLVGTDHSPGYGSAAKFLATSVLDIQMDMASYPVSNRITIIETMGRHTGWLAGACSLAEIADSNSQMLIYIPEVPFQLQDCLEKVSRAYEEKRNTVLIVAEGIRNSQGKVIHEDHLEYDSLGRLKLGGVSSCLKEAIEESTGIATRTISSSIWQRSSITLASKTDVDEAYSIGKEAWHQAEEGKTGVMVAMKRQSEEGKYSVLYQSVELEETAGKERFVPAEWYDPIQNAMTKQFKDYVLPIIQGEMLVPMEGGLPRYQRVM